MHFKHLELLSSHCPTLGSSDQDTSDRVLLTAVTHHIVQVEWRRVSFTNGMDSVDTSFLEILNKLLVKSLGVHKLLERLREVEL